GTILGSGSYGMVVSAVRRADGLPVAIKFLTRISNETALMRFLREARLQAQVRHPHVVGLIELDQVQEHPYLVLELLTGGSLRDLWREKNIVPAEQAARIMQECLAGLECCHRQGIIHRDLKPENILLGPDGEAKIADLGVAKTCSDELRLTRTGVLCGTP